MTHTQTRRATAKALEWWGGVECTINRVQSEYHDQLARSGHLARVCDIDAFLELGLSVLRMPVLWERAQPSPPVAPCFEHVAPHLERARSLGLGIVAGLVHHGSGPRCTGLLDEGFSEGLARYARSVAERFPWLTMYTPVNEPLTTARFSGLYGHWYPHLRSTRECFRMLVHQCRATVLAMTAVRKVQPEAKLLQTEDIGTTFASPGLQYQADYENQRRYLSLDLLSGKVDRRHPLHEHLVHEGIAEHELAWFLERPMCPDLIGINYYVTSDRYLDEALHQHPPHTHGGNGIHAYADIEAVRAQGVGIAGHEAVIHALAQRYGRPIVLSEVHLGCSREEQLRWLHEAHQAALSARARGVDVRALTVWALLGSFDWCSLVTRNDGVYEPGAFDLRGPAPRPTALAHMVRACSRGKPYDHPALEGTGWWRRSSARTSGRRPLVITGARSLLGRLFSEAAELRNLPAVCLDGDELDITSHEQVRSLFASLEPWAVINAAGASDLGRCPSAERCQRDHLRGPLCLAKVCAEEHIRFLTFTSEAVFDGKSSEPYLEPHPVAPASVLGAAQAAAERLIFELEPDALIVRTSALFARGESASIVSRILRALVRGTPVPPVQDAVVSPTHAPELVDVCMDLLVDGASGLWHVVNAGPLSFSELSQRIARLVALEARTSCTDPTLTASTQGRVGTCRALSSARATLMPAIDDALERYLKQRCA
jgi:dTDP-4-dehydrorhamnose reductase